jgi:antirestriction protein ArdC
VDDARDDEDASINERDGKTRRRFLLRYYRVWNLEQCELPAKVLDKLPTIETRQHDPIDAAERIIAEMPNPPRIEYCGSMAFYSPGTDCITLPPRELFISPLNFIARPITNLFTAQGARKDLREKDSARRPRSVRQSIPKKNYAPSSEPHICVLKPESPMQSLTTRQPTYPDGYRGCAPIANC